MKSLTTRASVAPQRAAGQAAEMSPEERARRLAAAVEILESVIERAIRARFGIPG